MQNRTKSSLIITPEFKDILHILQDTNESIFITGKAGTGKSSLLKHFRGETDKKMVVLAPTGVAALNVGGQTIHSFFKFPPQLIKSHHIIDLEDKEQLLEELDMVIIDEVSMVRVDLLNGVDLALRRNKSEPNKAFGGVQMVFIGDLFQLPPVVTQNDANEILNNYGGAYFFNAPVFNSFSYHFYELTEVFRQSDEENEFKGLLHSVRLSEPTYDDMVLLNSRLRDKVGKQESSIFLTSRRKIARDINRNKLNELPGEGFLFEGELSGELLKLKSLDEDKLEDRLPAPYKLKLKEGAQIMMLKNDSFKRWVNGSIGIVSKLNKDSISVEIDASTFEVEKESWPDIKFVINKKTNKIEELNNGEFKQYPIRLAYAMTIHKSQGKTFDRITVDVGRTGAFAHGQVYVALSRCRTLEGIVLNNMITDRDIIVDPVVVDYYRSMS